MAAWVILDGEGFAIRGKEGQGIDVPPDAIVLPDDVRIRDVIGLRFVDGLPTAEAKPDLLPPSAAERAQAELHRMRDRARRDFAEDLARAAQPIEGVVPDVERLTWPDKAIAADEAAGKTGTARMASLALKRQRMIRLEAALVGEAPEATLTRIEQNAAGFYLLGPIISGERRRLSVRVDAASTQEQIEGERALASVRLGLLIQNLAAVGADPEGFAASLPQTPEDMGP